MILRHFLIFLPVIIIACNNARQTPPVKKHNFVFVTTCVNEDFFKPVKKGMQDAAALMNVNCAFIGTPGVDATAQASMMDSVIRADADGIAINIIDSVAFDGVIEKALSKGIPVVGFNSDDNYSENKRLSTVSQNLYGAGVQLGNAMANKIQDQSTIMITVHSNGISALEERVKGIRESLKAKDLEFITVVTTNIVDSATAIVAKALDDNPEVSVVLCTGLADTEAAGNVIAERDSRRAVIAAGFDLSKKILQHIKNGSLLFTIDQQPYMQGFMPVVQLEQYKQYGIVPSDNEIGAAFVTRENVKQVEELTAAGYR